MGSPSIDALERESSIDALEDGTFDIAVIGGGITGAGIAREAALRGLRVAVIDANDFASGTSSRSSKLIHGGIRYLERGEFGLVRKTALERKEIRQLAPHLAEPRWMVMPLKSRTALYSFRLGVLTYERLGAVEPADGHRGWSGTTLEREEPVLDRKRFPHALAYREYLTDDARLVLGNLRSVVAHGAIVLNHAPAVEITVEEGRATGIVGECALTGRRFRVKARAVVNAAGPWLEAVQRLEDATAKPLLHLSKGIHVTLPASKLPVNNLLVIRAADRRRIFAIRRGAVVYVGTTDTTHIAGPQVWPEITREEVRYLLDPLPLHFKVDPFEIGDVVGAWAGLRPLIADPTKTNPSEISRRDELLTGAAGVLSVAGGKLTGYRGMARKVLSTIAERDGKSLGTLNEEPAIVGGDFDGDLEALARALPDKHGLGPRTAARLARLYGTEADAVASAGPQQIHPEFEVVRGEVEWAARHEGAVHLEDLVYRRLRLPLFDLGGTDVMVEPLAMAMAEVLGWTSEHTAAQISLVKRRLQQDLAFAG
jgi:glycerol-3-phosphate dehydrogenase